jgi:stage II sporulation protein R
MGRKNWMIYAVIIGIIVILGLSAFIQESQTQTKQEPEYIRFHVIANSDSPEDQMLKLRVRDLLLERFGQEFEKADSIENSRRLIREHLTEIEDIAREEVRRSGKTYEVQAQLGNFNFPTKAYGNLVLPAGEYEALRVVIGEGEGANWWCVMFPPLCFVDITHGVAREQVNDSDDGSNSETVSSLAQNDKEVRIEYKFKIVEWWERLLAFLHIG